MNYCEKALHNAHIKDTYLLFLKDYNNLRINHLKVIIELKIFGIFNSKFAGTRFPCRRGSKLCRGPELSRGRYSMQNRTGWGSPQSQHGTS